MQLGGFSLVFGLVEVVLFAQAPENPFVVVVSFPALAWVYVAAGIVAWLRRPASRIGSLLVVGGLLWLLAGLANTAPPALVAVGLVTATVPVAIVLHVLLAFPSGRLRGRWTRALAVGGTSS